MFTELLPETRSEKHGVMTWEPATNNEFSHLAGELVLSGRRSPETRYFVEEFPADHGRGFRLVKTAGGTDKTETQYFVFCGSDGVAHCDCKGFYSTGKCKHLASIAELVKAARI